MPYQVEAAKFKPPRFITPSWKGQQPFSLWSLDLVTRLFPPGPRGEDILIVAVCPFSKWVEAGPLPDRSSTTVAAWVHEHIVCRYGVPRAFRVDQGKEFTGGFREYCDGWGIRRVPIFTAHPQANGLVERYNAVIRAGLRKLAAAQEGRPWTELLPTVLAGMRFLPTRLGYPPAWLVFKQQVGVPGIDELGASGSWGDLSEHDWEMLERQGQDLELQQRWWA